MIPTNYQTLCEYLSKNPHIEVKHYCPDVNCRLIFIGADEVKITFKRNDGTRISFLPTFLRERVSYEQDGVYYHSVTPGKIIKYLYRQPKEAVVVRSL